MPLGYSLSELNALALRRIAEGDAAGALGHMTEALRLAPQHPGVHYNLGQIYGAMERHEDEIACYRRAIERKPDFADAYVNLGVALRDLGRFEEAFHAFKRALRIDPDHAGARTNRAQTNLLLGRYEQGWSEYEWRWKDGHQSHAIPGELWTGRAPLAGKRLLVHAEQGLGDTIQFIRYVGVARSLGAHVVLRVQDALLPLLSGYADAGEVIGESSLLPDFDLQIPLLSLPAALGSRCPGIPSTVPYLQAATGPRNEWAAKLDQHPSSGGRKARVGLVWSGSRTHLNDRYRSMRLEDWQPILAADVQVVSLQKDVRETDVLANLPAILDAGPELADFADTAGLIANLDVVVTVDTAVAHLAGAMGVPVWIALPARADWRWQLERSDSPWYPSARLFRQTRLGDWGPVVADVVRRLTKLTRGDRVDPTHPDHDRAEPETP
jgi:hypothetical protein